MSDKPKRAIVYRAEVISVSSKGDWLGNDRRAAVTQAMIERAAQSAGLTVTGVRIEGAVLEILTGDEKTAKAAKPTHRPDVRL